SAQEPSNGLRFPDQLLAAVGAVVFLVVWLFFLLGHHRTVPGRIRLLVNGSFLFALTFFLSLFSLHGNQLWWFRHLLLLGASLLYSIFLLRSCRNEVEKIQKDRKELEETKKKLSKVLECSPSLIALQDAKGRFVVVNKRFEKYFGLKKKEIIGRSEEEILPIQQHKETNFSEEQQEEAEYEETLCLNNEKRVLATSRFPLSCGGQDNCGVGYIRTDITDRKDLEYQLQLDQKILENAEEAIVITDADAAIVDVNKGYTRITGYEPKEIIGENPRVCQSGHHSKAFYKAMWKDLLENGRWSGEIWDRRKSGEVYLKWLTINAIYDNTNEVINYVGIFTDITEKKNVENQLNKLLFFDSLTNLPNRTLFEELLTQALHNCQFYNTPL
ncbi:MAG: PAS domain S-box protein, partial [Candidatus Electrothrix sp. ATG1]|nr:PAS domain S-box protein [Candidatus Electrothrix sp. ATG1]